MTTPDTFPDDHEPATFDLPEPSLEDIQEIEDEVIPKELKKKNLKKGLKKRLRKEVTDETVLDEITHMLNTQCSHPLLGKDESCRLVLLAKEGDKVARDTVILSNQRLIVSIAKRFVGLGMDLVELVSEGNIALSTALKNHTPNDGYVFSTYATWYIRGAIARAVADKGRTIRIPVEVVYELYAIKKEEERYTMKKGHKPSTKKLSELTGFPLEKIEFLKKARKRPASLNALVNGNEKTEMGALVEAASEIDENSRIHAEEVRAAIKKALTENNDLSPLQKIIFELRFGVNGQVHNTREIAAITGKDTWRVNEHIQFIKRSLRNHPELKELLDVQPGK